MRHTTVRFEPDPTALHSSVASYAITLAPQQRSAIFVSVASRGRLLDTTASFFRGLVALKRELKTATCAVASVETANSVVNEILCRSMADLYMLMTATQDGPYPYAGIPWYSTTFGRDGIITAMQMLWLDPAIAAGVLQRLARLQALEHDKSSDAAPGKILHEMRAGEMALLSEVPFRQYYGTVDATPLFVMLAGGYGERTGDWALIGELWPAIERALAWLDGPGDMDGDGFIEYARGAETGLSNQGWKDSYDSVFHADGRLAEGPIALVEVQGYAYAARLAAARCARALGLDERAEVLAAQAERLRGLFEERFWCEEMGFYALALDGRKAPCRVRTSNPGHALWSGIVAPERGAAVAAALLDSDFFSGWGVRTVAKGEARYNPMSYHNGSIWPHDNALLAQGLASDRQQARHRRHLRGADARDLLPGPAPHPGAVLRLSPPARTRANAVSGGLLAAGMGGRGPVLAHPVDAGPRVPSPGGRGAAQQPDRPPDGGGCDAAACHAGQCERGFHRASQRRRRGARGAADRGRPAHIAGGGPVRQHGKMNRCKLSISCCAPEPAGWRTRPPA